MTEVPMNIANEPEMRRLLPAAIVSLTKPVLVMVTYEGPVLQLDLIALSFCGSKAQPVQLQATGCKVGNSL
jgi:hypothetical protein